MKRLLEDQGTDLRKTSFKIQHLSEEDFVRKILRFEMHKVTVNGKTDICITYMQGAASEETSCLYPGKARCD